MASHPETITDVHPFEIRISNEVLNDLYYRLANTRWIKPVRENTWEYGIDVGYLQKIVDYWQHGYDWQKQEQQLNTFDHFKAEIEDHHIHFIHQRSTNKNAMPLLLLHGWPDSFYRFHKILPLLADSFDVIIPSLPGFGFTERQTENMQKQSVRRSGELLWKLMTEVLGYNHFAVAGGDGGSPIAQCMAIDHPESIMGIYLTDLGWHASFVDPAILSKREQHYLKASQKSFMKQGAYAMVQGTKPQTLAYDLTDSPVALAAWILDRFHFWTDGEIEDHFTKDELLTNIMIYWVTNTMGSSIRSYWLEMQSPSLTTKDYVNIPVGLGLFPKDIGGIPPREFAARTLNVQHWKEMPRGGHFTAWEEPELMAADLKEFFIK